MKSLEFITEATKLIKSEMAMGLTSYQNKEVLLAGGMRSGNSDAKHTRLKYMIYDIRGVTAEEFQERQEELEMGYVELFVVDATGDIDGLVNIKLNPKSRSSGVGRIVIESLKATVDGLKIFDIKRSAIPFWRKMGATFYDDQHFKNIATNTAKATRFGLYAIL